MDTPHQPSSPVPPTAFPAAPAVPASRPTRARNLLAPGLYVLAAVLVIGGLFLPLFRAVHTLSQVQAGALAVVKISAWTTSFELNAQDTIERPGAPIGVPLIVAAVLLLAAAGFLAAHRRVGAWLGQVGTVFAAGVVLTIEMIGLGESAGGDRDGRIDLTTELGMWLLIGGTLVAAAAAVVAHRAGGHRGADWADPAVAYADTKTPPSGFAVPEVQAPGGVSITVLPPDTPPEPPARPWEQPGH